MTMTQYLPTWLRSRFRKPAPLEVTRLSKKDRQVLPTLPNAKRPSILFENGEKPPGHKFRGLT